MRLMLWDFAPIAHFAVPLRLLMLTKADTATLPTQSPQPLVLAEGSAAAVLAEALHPLVLTEAAAAAVLAPALHPLVLAEATAVAVPALAPRPLGSAHRGRCRRSPCTCSPQSLHLLLCR